MCEDSRGGVSKLAYRECLFAVRGVQKVGRREALAGFCNQRCVCDVFRTKHTLRLSVTATYYVGC